jgi:hypothetical protein
MFNELIIFFIVSFLPFSRWKTFKYFLQSWTEKIIAFEKKLCDSFAKKWCQILVRCSKFFYFRSNNFLEKNKSLPFSREKRANVKFPNVSSSKLLLLYYIFILPFPIKKKNLIFSQHLNCKLKKLLQYQTD